MAREPLADAIDSPPGEVPVNGVEEAPEASPANDLATGDGDQVSGSASDSVTGAGFASPDTVAGPISKIARVLDLLSRAEGATLAELGAATGWLPHTTRAALTGLRKKGHLMARNRNATGVTVWHIGPRNCADTVEETPVPGSDASADAGAL